MFSMSLLGAADLNNWVVAVWVLGVGAAAGLALLLVLWGLAAAVSATGLFGAMERNPVLRHGVSIAIGAVVLAVLAAAYVVPEWRKQDTLESAQLAMRLAVAGLLSMGVGYFLVLMTSRRVVAEVVQAISEGPLYPILVTAACFAAFGVLGSFLVPEPVEILRSAARLPATGTRVITQQVPAASREILDDEEQDPPQHAVEVGVVADEVQKLVWESDQRITVDLAATDGPAARPVFEPLPNEKLVVNRGKSTDTLFAAETIDRFFVRNYGLEQANVKLTVVTAPPHPEVRTVVQAALSLVGAVGLYFLFRFLMPKVSAVALATFKSEIAQPLFLIIMIIGVVALSLFIWIPYHTLGEDLKMLKDTGMVLIKVLCIIQAVWAASMSVADEIEGRTALTVLSKPLTRRSFVIGKYLGIFWTMALVFILLGSFFLLVVAYKPLYDMGEGTDIDATWQFCHFEMMQVVPGLVLGFLETCIIAAISVAISTRLPMLANFVICFSVYVLGHLTPMLVQVSAQNRLFEGVRFVSELIATVLPVLDHFSIEASIAGGTEVPLDYLGWSLLYSLLFGMIALLLALVLFEDRDLA